MIRTITILSIVFLSFACGKSSLSDHPNILFILTDDQRWDALGHAGNPIIHTPNMDQLAMEGLFFRNAFVTTPICAASRASIFTGLYERTHEYTFGQPNLHQDYLRESYPYLLKKAGYKTGFAGKFGVKIDEGWMDSLFDYSRLTYWPYLKEEDGVTRHLADINGDHAIEFIRQNSNEPFCFSLSFWSPHADDGAKEQYFWPDYCDTLYQNTEIPVPATAEPEFFDNLPEFLQNTLNRTRWYWRFDEPEKFQQMVKGYYRMVSGVDSVMGRIRKTLEEEGIDDRTVIIFMGDNGYFLGERGYAGKWLMHETSIRVPMIMVDPRQPKRKRSSEPESMVLNIDITPTILELAGIPVPERYQGQSLIGFFDQEPIDWRQNFFTEHQWANNPLLPKTEAYRDAEWKFIRYEDQPDLLELYHHSEDPHEITNLAYQPEYKDIVRKFQLICDSIAASLVNQRHDQRN